MSNSLDELAQASPQVAGLYAYICRTLASHPHDSPGQMTAQAQRLMRELGVTFHLYKEESGRDHIVPLDLFPRVIEATEWELISEAMRQRLAIWNAFFKDIYGTQEILKTGLIPFELVFNDPNYQRAAVGVKVPRDTYVHVAAFDLAKNLEAKWVVIDDYVSTPIGTSYALQARHVLAQVCPELFKLANISPVHGYPTELLEHLRPYAQSGAAEPRIVLLSSGQYNNAYYEHSYFARQMGIPLVRSTDLIVLNTRVYLKTIGGLEPIDLIYRRSNDRAIDPLALARDGSEGVPGLMSCVRKGTVTIANAIGTGLGDNRGISAFLHRMARFYLNETLRLPSIERLLCFDRDQCEEVLSHLEDYRLTTLSPGPGNEVWNANEMSTLELEQLRQKIRRNSANFIAEPFMPLTELPSCVESETVQRHAGLRVFTLKSQASSAYPCALTRAALKAGSRVISSGLGGAIKDTWILRGKSVEEPRPITVVPSVQRRLHLSSRIADSLFWMGSYAERAENTTRALKVVQLMQLEDYSLQPAEAWEPLWETLARATGHSTDFFRRSAVLRKHSASHHILLERKNRNSVISCVERCRNNAQSIRESVAPEVWSVINRLYEMLEGAVPAKEKLSDQTPGYSKALQLQESILNQLDALSGSVEKNMLRDDGWHFWRLGVHLERAITTLVTMRQVFLKRQNELLDERRIDANLDALLRMLASLYAYRSSFQARPVLRNVAAMLLQDPQVPRSLRYCLDCLDQSLGSLIPETSHESTSTPRRQCAKLKAEVNFLELDDYFTPPKKGKAPRLTHLLADLRDKLGALSVSISDHYLYHQAINILK